MTKDDKKKDASLKDISSKNDKKVKENVVSKYKLRSMNNNEFIKSNEENNEENIIKSSTKLTLSSNKHNIKPKRLKRKKTSYTQTYEKILQN